MATTSFITTSFTTANISATTIYAIYVTRDEAKYITSVRVATCNTDPTCSEMHHVPTQIYKYSLNLFIFF